jgi:hypothetical protein
MTDSFIRDRAATSVVVSRLLQSDTLRREAGVRVGSAHSGTDRVMAPSTLGTRLSGTS